MSRGDRGDISAAFRIAILAIATVLWAVMIWNMSADYAERRIDAESRASQYAHSAAERIQRACRGIEGAALSECAAEQIETTRENERGEYDLQAQQDMADWAFWMTFVAVCSLALGVAGLWLVRETLLATRETVNETRRIGEAQVSAYLTGTSVEVGFTSKGVAVVKCTVSNAGQSPARAVRCKTSVSFDTAEGYKKFDKPYGAMGVFMVDIPAGAEQNVDTQVVADGSLWLPDNDTWYIGATVLIEAENVFGRPIIENESFFGSLEQAPDINTWIKLDRSGRFGHEQGDPEANQPRLL